MKVLDYTSLYNGRDIGGMKTLEGKTIKYGRLYRSGALINSNEHDQKILDSLCLTDIIDFREEGALLRSPDYQIKGVHYHNFSPLNIKILKGNENNDLMTKVKKIGGGYNFMRNIYRNMFQTTEGIKAYTNFFQVLLEKDDAVILWHCAQGKDRAGMASFLLEIALGVSKEDAIKDYLTSNIAMKKYIDDTLEEVITFANGEEEVIKSYKEAYTVNIDYLNEAIKYIEDTYQSLNNFIENILHVDIKKLKNIYLE